MQDLKTNREKLNVIDTKMKELYLERMAIVKEIAAYKKAHGLATLDGQREKEMKERLSADLDDDLKKYYLMFLDVILKTSKDLQDEKKQSD